MPIRCPLAASQREERRRFGTIASIGNQEWKSAFRNRTGSASPERGATMMDRATLLAEPEPDLAAQSPDPLAVGLANASLLGAGYVMLRRWSLALGTGLVTVVLVTILASAAPSVWFVVAALLWWAAVIVHGWYLANRSPRPVRRSRVRQQRLVALGVTVPVLLAVGLLRFDAGRIERDTAEARRSGDCPQALAALKRMSGGHHVAAHLADRGDDTVQACALSRRAAADLHYGLTGDIEALDAGFSKLSTILAELPGHERVVERVLDGFLAGLPTGDACQTKAVTDWLGGQQRVGDGVLSGAVEVVPRVAPAAIVGCADTFLAQALVVADQQGQPNDWQQARERYEQLLDQYPDHELATKARDKVKQATLAIELANVRDLLDDGYGSSLPSYCDKPAPYSGAAPYRRNMVNRALLYGPELASAHNSYNYRGKLPASWLTGDVTKATLVICAGETQFGARVNTCPYENDFLIQGYSFVTFRKVIIPVRVYELRTGRLVKSIKVHLRGSSCPRVLKYRTLSGLTNIGPPSEVYVTPSTSHVRAAFGPLFK
ncbi:tol-pal system YbgF family protein [Micromonospora sp. NPDC007230]|uniref:tetratricopeptide repeat protein n=1 Tax=Micromonospora sp. NPDC007230 TaxID=3364237 RepID=UPI00369D9060